MFEAVSGCIEGACEGKRFTISPFLNTALTSRNAYHIRLGPTKQPQRFAGLLVTIDSLSGGGHEQKLLVSTQDVSPKSVSNFSDSTLVHKCHKRQRGDAILEDSSAGFLISSCPSVGHPLKKDPAVAREDMCKPRAIYPDNFKAPKVNDLPRSRRSANLEVSDFDWNSASAPSDFSVSSHHNVGLFNMGSVHANNANKVGEPRRLFRQRSHTDSCNSHCTYERDTPSSDYGGHQHSQLALDLERISLTATSFSSYSPSHSRLLRRRSPVVPVMFAPIQPAYTRLDTVLAGSSVDEDEEEDGEHPELLFIDQDSAPSPTVPIMHYQQFNESYESNSSFQNNRTMDYFHLHSLNHNIISFPLKPLTPENSYFHCTSSRTGVAERIDIADEDTIIFSMDVWEGQQQLENRQIQQDILPTAVYFWNFYMPAGREVLVLCYLTFSFVIMLVYW